MNGNFPVNLIIKQYIQNNSTAKNINFTSYFSLSAENLRRLLLYQYIHQIRILNFMFFIISK